MKRKIGLDLDGVVADFVSEFLVQYNAKYNTSFKYEDITQFDISKALNEPSSQVFGLIWQMQMDESYRSLKAYDGASQSIYDLRKSCEFTVISDRPNSSDTQKWLYNNGFPYCSVYLTSKKLKVMESKGIDVLIDDRGETALEISSAGKTALLFDRPWNQDVEGTNIIRCKSWTDIKKVLK